jgi:hypothetical protein
MNRPGRTASAGRCDVTGNPFGTDTWAEGHPCECASCQKWISTRQSTFDFDKSTPDPVGKLKATAIALRHYLVLAQPYINPKHHFARRIEKLIEETSWLDR